MEDSLKKSLFDQALAAIDIEDIEKGAYGQDRYINDPTYKPQLTVYNRGGHTVRAIVYKKDSMPVQKEKMKHQHQFEKDMEAKDHKGHKVKVGFHDNKGQHHETEDAEIHGHDEHHVHVKLNKDLKDSKGNTVHKKGKVIPIPKTGNKKWGQDAGKNWVHKVHEKLSEKDQDKVEKKVKKELGKDKEKESDKED